jgi:hypothetical protein
MYRSPGLLPTFGLLLGSRIEKHLCTDCQRDLETWKSADVDPRLAFKGPFLIRREEDYSVVSLPYCEFMIPTHVEGTLDWKELLAFLKDTIRDERKAALNEGQKSKKRM